MYDRLRMHLTRLRPRVYLDHAAATPVRREVLRAMTPYWREEFANPSAIHEEGRRAREAVEAARERVARTLRVRAREVIFTSGGTEANNLALIGTVEAALSAGRAPEEIEVISTPIEHASVLATLRVLEDRGIIVRYVSVDAEGRVRADEFEKLLSERTLLVTLALVNSEIGVVQDARRLSRLVRAHERLHSVETYLHLDASQAPLWLPVALDSLGADLLTLDAAKCCGPKGVGALIARERAVLAPLAHGGGQERGLRSGTEAVPLIVGLAEALCLAQEGVGVRAQQVAELRDALIEELEEAIPDLVLNGSREHRVANNVNVSISGVDGEFAVVSLDAAGIAAATRSACEGGGGGGSHVVRALMGNDPGAEERARSTVRFTFGEGTTRREVRRAAKALAAHVHRARADH